MTKQKQYIDRTALLRQAETLFDGQREVMGVKAEHIYSAPVAEVAEVVHGTIIETIKDGKSNRVFSCCGKDYTTLTMWMTPNFCPNCGAKMDGGTHDKTK